MNLIYDNWNMWQKLLTMLEYQFGSKCEFILHDLTKDYNHSIVDIRNGYITNRKIGDCGSNLGLEVLRGTVQDGDRYNYIVNTRDGKLLRSSTMFIHDENGKVIGSLCINTDITETVHFEEYLRRYNQYSVPMSENSNLPPSMPSPDNAGRQDMGANIHLDSEIFANDVSQVLDYLILQADHLVGKPVSKMNREDKINFIKYLDQKGAFLITKASERVYEHLNISRYTLYNYLDLIRKEDVKAGTEQEDENENES